ncbi:hypothetical protein XELAEV_18035988mg [Xenopus laevis]|uniref:Uncharacterized protein n=1 Tax=Xenopus laevis TaxID=8355 RepID=A0A974HCM2_XENLA|nr:hypothetical protein XELAEV_18035988mg [Xenopus laevis]
MINMKCCLCCILLTMFLSISIYDIPVCFRLYIHNAPIPEPTPVGWIDGSKVLFLLFSSSVVSFLYS